MTHHAVFIPCVSGEEAGIHTTSHMAVGHLLVLLVFHILKMNQKVCWDVPRYRILVLFGCHSFPYLYQIHHKATIPFADDPQFSHLRFGIMLLFRRMCYRKDSHTPLIKVYVRALPESHCDVSAFRGVKHVQIKSNCSCPILSV